MNSKQRRELLAAANRLDARVAISPGEISDDVVAHVRSALGRSSLIKVRIQTRDREECDATAHALAARCSLELVQVVGRVAVLHAPAPAG
jgi:RNA-binding protein YhbY